jgi:hypothetical protein
MNFDMNKDKQDDYCGMFKLGSALRQELPPNRKSNSHSCGNRFKFRPGICKMEEAHPPAVYN